ncbi:hypothetical protein BGX31_004623 [Mortierella sp. GBA43]|nr:hypothetical protein BGX31_004623 [Mortierella sp. GBA43]
MNLQPAANQGDQSQSTESNSGAPALATTANKKDAFKDMLRQRQAALRTHRASATPSDTRSRRSTTAGYPGIRDYYPHTYEYHDERGISLQSLRDEALSHPHWNQYHYQHQDPALSAGGPLQSLGFSNDTTDLRELLQAHRAGVSNQQDQDGTDGSDFRFKVWDYSGSQRWPHNYVYEVAES